jgi:hypothetical protein
MRALQLVVRCVLVAVLIVVPSLSFGTAAYAGDGDKNSESEKKDKDDKDEDEGADAGDGDGDDQGNSEDAGKSEDAGNEDAGNDEDNGKGDDAGNDEDAGEGDDAGKDEDAGEGDDNAKSGDKGNGAISGNGQAKGHDKGVGEGHENGNGLGHVKYDGGESVAPQTPIEGVALLAFSVTSADVVAAASPVVVPAASRAGKVTICHRTNAESHPYETVSPNANGVINGHAGHTGPIFTPGLKAQGIKWGDIIPPFDFGPGLQHSGLNWSSDGQLIFGNGCRFGGSTAVGDPGPSRIDDGQVGGIRAVASNDDDDDDDDDSDDDDNDTAQAGGLPHTGGPALWILFVGGLLATLGVVVRRAATRDSTLE